MQDSALQLPVRYVWTQLLLLQGVACQTDVDAHHTSVLLQLR